MALCLSMSYLWLCIICILLVIASYGIYTRANEYTSTYIYVCREKGVILCLCIASIIWSPIPKSQFVFISLISSLSSAKVKSNIELLLFELRIYFVNSEDPLLLAARHLQYIALRNNFIHLT